MPDGVRWDSEYIPDESQTYMRAHSQYFRGKLLQPGVFRKRDGGMSVDWDKYSTPEQTRQRCASPPDNAVIRLAVIGVRDIPKLDVHPIIRQVWRTELTPMYSAYRTAAKN
jgi:hypothetical protein